MTDRSVTATPQEKYALATTDGRKMSAADQIAVSW